MIVNELGNVTSLKDTIDYRKTSISSVEHSIQHLIENLNKKLKERQIPLTVLEGMEMQFYREVEKDIEIIAPPGNSKYLLINLLTKKVPRLASIVFFEMQVMGYIPIITDSEKYYEFRKNPNVLIDLVKKGVLVQINASSLIGLNGRAIRRFSLKMCKNNLVHFVLSDALFFEKRPILLKSAYDYLQKKISYEYVKHLKENARLVGMGIEFNTPPPKSFK